MKDDLDDLLGAMNSTLDLLGEHPIDRDTYQALHCVPIPDFYARVLGRPLTGDEWATAEGEFTRFLSQRPVRLRKGARALLAHLRYSGYSQSLLSLLPHTRLLAETAESGVTHLFDRIDGRRAPGTTKAQALATHLEAMGRPLDGHHEVLLIGDTRDDAVAARVVGAHVVLITGGLENAASLHQASAAVADGLNQAVELGLRLVPHSTRGTALTTRSGTRQPIPGPRPEIDRRGASRRTH
ncbi:HAD family hydrolase [Streptomyces anulatus]|uniref:HAD family hydrolase n=1 Tax=Streptomyces anulatus TaxID=1892 RepID=A0A6G3T152_STRAQ|nr:HAD family hydrolase [Streptomyces anulatus]